MLNTSVDCILVFALNDFFFSLLLVFNTVKVFFLSSFSNSYARNYAENDL